MEFTLHPLLERRIIEARQGRVFRFSVPFCTVETALCHNSINIIFMNKYAHSCCSESMLILSNAIIKKIFFANLGLAITLSLFLTGAECHKFNVFNAI